MQAQCSQPSKVPQNFYVKSPHCWHWQFNFLRGNGYRKPVCRQIRITALFRNNQKCYNHGWQTQVTPKSFNSLNESYPSPKENASMQNNAHKILPNFVPEKGWKFTYALQVRISVLSRF